MLRHNLLRVFRQTSLLQSRRATKDVHEVLQKVTRESRLLRCKGDDVIILPVLENKLSNHAVKRVFQVKEKQKHRTIENLAGIEKCFANVRRDVTSSTGHATKLKVG